MPKTNAHLLSFNRGEIGKHALGRIDVEQLRLAAQTQLNFVPFTLGPMMFRPGTQYLGSTHTNSQAFLKPFVFGATDTAVLEFGDGTLRIWIDDELLTVPSVSTTITNGDFSSGVGWTLTASSGAASVIGGGSLNMNAKALGSSASAEVTVNVAGADFNIKHYARIVVTRGPVTFQIGSTSGADDLVAKTSLNAGQHMIAFTPITGQCFPRFSTTTKTSKLVDSIQIEAAGTLIVPAPWSIDDVANIRTAQSGDIVYVACEGFQQRQVERRDNDSWSVVLYEPVGGPYTDKPVIHDQTVTFVSQGSGGTVPITAGANYFDSADHVNSLIKLQTEGQSIQTDLVSASYATDPIEVNGAVATDRLFGVVVTGTWVGTIFVQRSVTGPNDGFVNIGAGTTVNISNTVDDSADYANITAWYRARFTSYTSGVATVTLGYGPGGGTGQGRIVSVTSGTSATIEVVEPFASESGTLAWFPGEWSGAAGWPSTVEIYDGRLWWGGRDKIWGSVSDDFTNFDEELEGDAGPINRSFGSGPFANVGWIMGLSRLLVGRDSSVASIRASNLDSPLTPTDFTVKDCSTKGAASLPALKVDTRGVYVDKSGRRVYSLVYNVETYDYRPVDLTRFNADIGEPGFVDCAVQFQPDTRLHFVRADGQVAVMTYEFEEGVEAWWRILIGGSFEDGDAVVESVCVLPGDLEDKVYYVVKRTINGTTKRYVERLVRQDECVGGTLNKNMDAHIVYSGASTTTITGLSHLEGEEVVAWGNGRDLGTYTVSSGQVTLSEAVSSAVVGLSYEGLFQSAKLAYAAALGSPMNQKKKIDHLGLVLADTHYQGLEYGPDFTTMDGLPLVEEGEETADDTIWSEFDAPMIEFPGEWHTDSRLCLRATAPRPATVLACVVGITTHDKT